MRIEKGREGERWCGYSSVEKCVIPKAFPVLEINSSLSFNAIQNIMSGE